LSIDAIKEMLADPLELGDEQGSGRLGDAVPETVFGRAVLT